MPRTYKNIGGLDWPVNTPEWFAFLQIARLGHSPNAMYHITGERKSADDLGLMNPGYAMIRCAKELLTPEEFSFNRWSEQILYELTNQKETILAGAASCGKSFVSGLWSELWRGGAPDNTAIFMGSTSVSALRRRTFIGVIRYHNLLKQKIPGWSGIYSRSLCAIVNEDENREGITADDISTGILGIAFFGSSSPEVQATRIGGTHMSTVPGAPDYGKGSVVVILDEMQALPGEAISRSLVNLSSGTDLARIVGSGNFNSRTDMLGDRAEPKVGWSAVDIDTDKSWTTTRNGLLIRLDAYDSPAVVEEEGDIKYPFLVGPAHIERMLNEVRGQEDHPAFLSMARAWPRLDESALTVFPMTLQSKYKVREAVEWAVPNAPREKVLALDPAFTAGGDNAAVCILELGLFADGTYGANVAYLGYLNIDAKTTMPVAYQLSTQVEQLAREHRIPAHHIGVDDSATQNVADIIAMAMGESTLVRINYASKASEDPASEFTDKTAHESWANLITELWFRVVEYSASGQLRGLPVEAARQFGNREIVPDRLPVRLSKKKDHKQRHGCSPDDADVVAMALYVARKVCGFYPGASAARPGGGFPFQQAFNQGRSPDYMESTFSDEETYST